MAIYQRYILPHIIHLACGAEPAMRQRAIIVPAATGRVLEIGFGSGLNLPYYDADEVSHLWALEPSAGMRVKARAALAAAGLDAEVIDAPAESIPLDNHCADTVVVIYTMCSIAKIHEALTEIRRVLKPAGNLLFCEHGAAPDESVRRWQDLANPLWKALGGGCHLNRPIPAMIDSGGFRFHEIESRYLPGWRPATFNYFGRARPR